MDYPLARLGAREFEQLLQSLCKARLGPRVEAFGDGPDGGRDAVIRAESSGPRMTFTTNVVLAGASGGGIEKVGALMARYASKLGGLKGWRVWHYDDIRGELDNAPGVRAAFGLTTPGEIAAEIATRLVELQKKAAGRSDLMDGFPGLTGVDTGAVSAFDRALTGVLAAHREACTLSGEGDPWLLPAFEETVLRHMLGALRGIYAGPTGSADVVTPAERLLLRVIPLYIDAVLRPLPRTPRMNAICERVIGTLRRELLDRTLILGERHLALILREYVVHYDRHRPHQSRQQLPPDTETQPVRDVADLRSVRRKPVVAGVINEYYHAA